MLKFIPLYLLLLFSYNYIYASSISLHNAPLWITSSDEEQSCAIGIGSRKSVNAHAQAMLLATLEYTMTTNTKVSSLMKLHKEAEKENFTSTSKFSGFAQSVRLKEKTSWKNKQGDYFVLACKDNSASPISFPFVVKYYQEQTTVNKKTNYDNFFQLKIADKILIEEKGVLPKKITHIFNKNRPKWVDININKEGVTLAQADVIDNDIQTAYLKAMLNARKIFAEDIYVQLFHITKSANQDENKEVISQNVKGSFLKALWLDDINKKLYVLLQLK